MWSFRSSFARDLSNSRNHSTSSTWDGSNFKRQDWTGEDVPLRINRWHHNPKYAMGSLLPHFIVNLLLTPLYLQQMMPLWIGQLTCNRWYCRRTGDHFICAKLQHKQDQWIRPPWLPHVVFKISRERLTFTYGVRRGKRKGRCTHTQAEREE